MICEPRDTTSRPPAPVQINQTATQETAPLASIRTGLALARYQPGP